MSDNRLIEWNIAVTPEEKEAIERLLHDMRAGEAIFQPSAKDVAKCKRLLPSPQQIMLYKDCVRAYYMRYIVERNIPHKTLMIHWAAVYQAIAMNIGTNEFYGPEYDYLLFNVCGIKYNNSSEKRGRYRAVGNVYEHYRILLNNEREPETNTEEHDLELFRQFWRNMRQELPFADNKKVNYGASSVPKSPFNN